MKDDKSLRQILAHTLNTQVMTLTAIAATAPSDLRPILMKHAEEMLKFLEEMDWDL